jgi:hypothetical protein
MRLRLSITSNVLAGIYAPYAAIPVLSGVWLMGKGMLFDREETRAQKMYEIRIRISGQIKIKIVLFYSFIYIFYYLFSSQK